MTCARPPFDGVDLILISHGHSDHFEPQIVGNCLQNNPQAVLVSMGSVIDELKKRFSGFDRVRDRVRGVHLGEKEPVQMTIHGIDLEIINAPADVPNLGFLIQTGGLVLFHTGDSGINRAMVDLFQSYHLPDKRIDLAFVPWQYLGDEWYHPLLALGQTPLAAADAGRWARPRRFRLRCLTFEYLFTKADREAHRREDRAWSGLSLAFAMRGMEDEAAPTYTTADFGGVCMKFDEIIRVECVLK